jgi:hypothetical protein
MVLPRFPSFVTEPTLLLWKQNYGFQKPHFKEAWLRIFVDKAHSQVIPLASHCYVEKFVDLKMRYQYAVSWYARPASNIERPKLMARVTIALHAGDKESTLLKLKIANISIKDAFRQNSMGVSLLPSILGGIGAALISCKDHIDPAIYLDAAGDGSGLNWGSLAWAKYADFDNGHALQRLQAAHVDFVEGFGGNASAIDFDLTPEWICNQKALASTWRTPMDIKRTCFTSPTGEPILFRSVCPKRGEVRVPYGPYFLLQNSWEERISFS